VRRGAVAAASSFLAALALNTAASIALISPDLLRRAIWEVPRGVGLAYARISPAMWLDSLRHGVAGLALGALSYGSPSMAVLAALYSMALDLDHAPYLVGLPVPGRISHSLMFLAVSSLTCWAVTRDRRHVLMLISCLLLHYALDGLNVPLLFPLSSDSSSWRWLRIPFAAISVAASAISGPLGARIRARFSRKEGAISEPS